MFTGLFYIKFFTFASRRKENGACTELTGTGPESKQILLFYTVYGAVLG